KDQTLAAQLAVGHHAPVTVKPLVPRASCPHIRNRLCFLLIAQEFLTVIGIAEVLNLKTLLLAKRGEHERNLILKVVYLANLSVDQVWSFKDETLRHIAALLQRIEDNQIIEEVPVGRSFKHNGCWGWRSGVGPKPGPLNQ